MKKSMMMVMAVAVMGLSGLSQAAQPEQKSGQDRVKSEYGVAEKKCDGLKGDAKSACLKDAARVRGQGQAGDGAAAGSKMQDEKK